MDFPPTRPNNRKGEAGSVVTLLLGGVVLVGVLSFTAYNLLSGPVRSAAMVTMKTKAQNDVMLGAKLLMRAAGDGADADGVNEPPAFDPAVTPHPGGSTGGGGGIPASSGAPKIDPWKVPYGLCSWNHGTANTGMANVLNGDSNNGTWNSKIVIAVISAGPNRTFETTCDPDPGNLTIPAGSDDIVQQYTFEEAQVLELWKKRTDLGNEDKIQYSNDSVIIGNPVTPTSDKLQVEGDGRVSQNLTVGGNATVSGNTTVVGTTTTKDIVANGLVTMTGNGATSSISNVAGSFVSIATSDTTMVTNLNSNYLGDHPGSYYLDAANMNAGQLDPSHLPTFNFDVNLTRTSATAVTAIVKGIGGYPIEDSATWLAGDTLVFDGVGWNAETSSLNGDVTGAFSANSVVRIQGRTVANSAPGANTVLGWDGSQWKPMTISVGNGSGTVIGAGGVNFLATDSNINAGACSAGQIPKYNGTNWVCAADLNNAGNITGTISAQQVAFGSGANAITGSDDFKWDGTDLAIVGNITVSGTLSAAGTPHTATPATKILVDEGGVISYRTAAEIIDDGGVNDQVNFLALDQNINATDCIAGHIPKYDGTEWHCVVDNSASVTIGAGQIAYGGPSNDIVGSPNLTWNGSTIAVTGGLTTSTTIAATGNISTAGTLSASNPHTNTATTKVLVDQGGVISHRTLAELFGDAGDAGVVEVTLPIDVEAAPNNSGFRTVMHRTGVPFLSFVDNGGNESIYLGVGTGSNGWNTGVRNAIVGHAAGGSASFSDRNAFLGAYVGGYMNDGDDNVILGYEAGAYATGGDNNAFIGRSSGSGATGSNNVFIGRETGRNTTGNNNTFLGHLAGDANTSGASNILIGAGIDGPTVTTSNYLNIGNTVTGTMGANPATPGSNDAALTVAGTLSVAKLDTDNAAPTTSGTTKMVVSDANGLLSFVNMPGTGGAGQAAGDINEIQFNDGGDNLAADANFVWDNANDRLGIGTATPSVKLDVVGDAVISGNVGIGVASPTSALQVLGSGAKTATYVGTALSNTATSSTASINKIGLDVSSTGTWNGASANNVGLLVSSVTGGTNNYDAIFNGGGNVGIGNAAPTKKLDITGTLGVSGNVTLSALDTDNTAPATSGTTKMVVTDANGLLSFADAPAATGAAGSIGQVQFNGGSSAFAADSNFFWDNTNKRLGIATSTLSSRLQVAGTNNISSGTDVVVGLFPTINQSGTASYNALRISPYEQGTGSGNKNLIDAGTNSAANGGGTHTSRFAVTSSGAVGIGTGSPSMPLDVATSGTNSGIRVGSGTVYLDILQNMGSSSWNPLVSPGNIGLIYKGASIDTGGGLVIGPWTNYGGMKMDNVGRVLFSTGTAGGTVSITGGTNPLNNLSNPGNYHLYLNPHIGGSSGQSTGIGFGGNNSNSVATASVYSLPDSATYGGLGFATKANGGSNTQRMSITSSGSVIVNSLDTDNTAPTTSGTTKMVVSDANGLLSFATIPTGGAGQAAGSTGQVQFNDGSNNLTADSNFFWDNTNKRLGLGTGSPTSRLSVSGSLTASSGTELATSIVPTINQSGSAGYNALRISPYEQATGSSGKYLIDAGTNSAANGGGTHTSKFTVLNNGDAYFLGKVGIGAYSNGGDKLYVYGDGTTTTLQVASGLNSASSAIILSRSLYDAQIGIAGAAGNFTTDSSAGDLIIQTKSGRKTFFNTNYGSDVSTMALSGSNVGIGTASPTSVLHTVASGAKTATYVGNALSNTATSSTASVNKIGLDVSSTGTWNGTSANNVGLLVSAVTGGTNNYDAIFNGGGNVGIGNAAPAKKLDITGTLGVSGDVTLSALDTNGSAPTTSGTTKMVIADENGKLSFTDAPAATGAAGDVNEIQFNDGSDGFTADANFVWDDANDRLGVGTATPTVALDITGDAAVSGDTAFGGNATVAGTASVTGNVTLSSLDTDNTAPATSGTTKMVVVDEDGLLSFDDIPTTNVTLPLDADTAPAAINGGGGKWLISKDGGTQQFLSYVNAGGNESTYLGDGTGRRGYQSGFRMTVVGSGAGIGINGNANRGAFFGAFAGENFAGDDNTLLGYGTGYGAAGNYNTYVGSLAGFNANGGDDNPYIGRDAGKNATSGDNNVFLGSSAGLTTTTGSSNILIGKGINATGATASSELNIGNTIFGSMGANPATPGSNDAALSLAGTLSLTSLDTDVTAPVTSGATKMVVVDANGLLSFANAPAATGAAGSTGQVQFNDGANAFAADSNFVWDNTNKRLGIGTNTPTSFLHVENANNTTIKAVTTGSNKLSAVYAIASGGAGGGIYSFGSSYSTSGAYMADASYLAGDGSAGLNIGSSSASGPLRFYSGGDADANLRMFIAANGNITLSSLDTDSTAPTTSGTTKMVVSDANGLLSFATIPTGGAGQAAGSTGQVQFNDGSNNLAADSNFFWDNTNKRLGIGTNAPSVPLEINPDANGTAMALLLTSASHVAPTVNTNGASTFAGFRFDRNSSEKWFIGIGNQGDNLLFRRTGSVNDMMIDATGGVSIRTLDTDNTAPATSGATKMVIVDANGLLSAQSLGASAAAGNDTEVQYNDGGTTNGDSGMTFDDGANLLTVAGGVTTGGITLNGGMYWDPGNSAPPMTMARAPGDGAYFSDALTNDYIYRTSGHNGRFLFGAEGTNGSDPATLRISKFAVNVAGSSFSGTTSGGNWTSSFITMPNASGWSSGIGTSTNAWVAQVGVDTHWFSNALQGDVVYRNTTGRLLFGTTADVTSGMMLANNELIIGTNSDAGAYKLQVVGDAYVDGNITATGTVSSDRRLKTNIKTFSSASALEKVQALQGVTYDWKKEFKPNDKRNYIGLIAQDVQKVAPSAVFAVDSPSKLVDGKMLTINYDQLVPLLIEATKEQQKEIDTLKDVNKAQQTKIDDLETRMAKIEKMLGEKAEKKANMTETPAKAGVQKSANAERPHVKHGDSDLFVGLLAWIKSLFGSFAVFT